MIITDFHSHILPGVDDGSAGVEESLAMLRVQAEQGIGRVAATPHFYPAYDSPERFLRRREEAALRLREAMESHPDLPEVILGAEVYFFSGISDSDILNQLTIGEKHSILIEMPHAPWTNAMYQELEQIWVRQNLTPVIAHIDRYIGPFRTFGIPERLAELPVLVQANAEFFLDKRTSRMAMRMLREDRIQLLGSDCHNMRSRKPNLGEAVRLIEKKLGQDVLARVDEYGKEILNG